MGAIFIAKFTTFITTSRRCIIIFCYNAGPTSVRRWYSQSTGQTSDKISLVVEIFPHKILNRLNVDNRSELNAGAAAKCDDEVSVVKAGSGALAKSSTITCSPLDLAKALFYLHYVHK